MIHERCSEMVPSIPAVQQFHADVRPNFTRLPQDRLWLLDGPGRVCLHRLVCFQMFLERGFETLCGLWGRLKAKTVQFCDEKDARHLVASLDVEVATAGDGSGSCHTNAKSGFVFVVSLHRTRSQKLEGLFLEFLLEGAGLACLANEIAARALCRGFLVKLLT